MRNRNLIVSTGALLGLAAAAGVMHQASSSWIADLPPREDREQAARVVNAYLMNGAYTECMDERGYDLRWEWGIHLAPSLEGDPELEAVAEDLEAKMRGEGREKFYSSQQFSYDSNYCGKYNPGASDDDLAEVWDTSGMNRAEKEKHWNEVMDRARELGWSPDKPFGDLTPPGLDH